jgi:acid phosphatase type 7
MPAEQPDTIRFIVGGDVYGDAARVAAMHQLAASLDPMFIIFGGDIAYANGKPTNLERWYTFFDLWQEHLVAPDGRQIPVIVAVGNHEVRRDLGVITSSPFFPNLFALPRGRSYYAIDFAEYMSVVILDTDHLARVPGRQTRWLAQALGERQDVPHIFPAYHVPAYPSVRRLDARVNRKLRRHWVPLFEQAGVRFSFEHHDHSYKRTPPILDGRVHPDGIVFMGDGAWGVGTRPTRDPDQTWYLERAEPLRHLILVDLDEEGIRVIAKEADGRLIDEYARPHAPPIPAEQN